MSNIEIVTILIAQDFPEALMPLEIKRGDKGSPYPVRSTLEWSVNGPLGSGSKALCINFGIMTDYIM